MYFSVDRKVGSRAVLMGEDNKQLEVPTELLPAQAHEGDMVLYEDGRFLPAPEKTEERRARMSELIHKLLAQAEDYVPGGYPAEEDEAAGADARDTPGEKD